QPGKIARSVDTEGSAAASMKPTGALGGRAVEQSIAGLQEGVVRENTIAVRQVERVQYGQLAADRVELVNRTKTARMVGVAESPARAGGAVEVAVARLDRRTTGTGAIATRKSSHERI